LGPWWVHIGDDFVKDVVAGKDLSMRTVWCRELVMEKIHAQQEAASKSANSANNTRTVEELVKEVGETKVLRMQVGSVDYLTDSLHREFADAIVDSFGDLGSLLNSWHEAALSNFASIDSTEEATAVVATDVPDEMPIVAAGSRLTASEVATSTAEAIQEGPASSMKYCVFCGAKLPSVARFCSSCGEKQAAQS